MRESIYRAKSINLLRTAAAVFWSVAAVCVWAGDWLPLARDGVHDPKSPAVRLLQQPRDALSVLTPDTAGNQVRWVESLEKGEIKPRSRLRKETQVRTLDQDILLDIKGSMPIVRFPHKAHTEWLDCSNCHEYPFKSLIGGTKISMFSILQGEQCGVCHGAVSFPLTECLRCHSVPRPKSEQTAPPNLDPSYHLPRKEGP